MKTLPVFYFSDVLCVWAYVAQRRLDHISQSYGPQVRIEYRFCSVFGDAHRKVATAWSTRDGFQGFNAHLRQAVAAFPDLSLNPDIWLTVRPSTSHSSHVFLKAIELAELQQVIPAGACRVATWMMRQAFFEQARDIACRSVQWDIARTAGISKADITPFLDDGRAFAALASDYQDAEATGVQGSPSFVMNEGRQKFYGNIGYRILDANLKELLREPQVDQASWC